MKVSEDPDMDEVSKSVYEEMEGSSEEEDSGEDEGKYSSLEELLEKTGTMIEIKKVGTEPSPIFGPNDTKPHDKYKITFRNKNGFASFTFWESLYSTENGIEPKKEEIIASIGMDCADYGNSMSLEEFRENFGYENADADISQKSYDGFRKTVEDVRRMFPGDDYDEFVRLSVEES